ncbi:MAG: hypothetical protein K8R74_10320 [Bacteroidales bacterium]|nr:hypothetical protein [Bacteroidales bacterium]
MELKSIYKVKSIKVSGLEISARIAFNKDHMVFKGHFPGNPVVPGVVQVQVLKDVLENVLEKKVFLNRTKSIKFLNVISPLDVGEVLFEIVYEQQTDNNFAVKCVVKTETQVYMKYSGSALVIDNFI